MSTTARIRRRWTKEEDQALRVEVYSQENQGASKDWHRIAAKLPGRTNKDCRKRWSKICESVKKGIWDAAEDRRLEEAVKKYGLRWTQVAQVMGTRHADQCAKRWQHFLDPNLDRSEWSAADDKRLLSAVEMYGHNWKSMVANAFPGRSTTNVKNRYAIMDRRRQGQKISTETTENNSNNNHNINIDSDEDSSDVGSNDDCSSQFELDNIELSPRSSDLSSDNALLDILSQNTDPSLPNVATISPAPSISTDPHLDSTFTFDKMDEFLSPECLMSFDWENSRTRTLDHFDTAWQPEIGGGTDNAKARVGSVGFLNSLDSTASMDSELLSEACNITESPMTSQTSQTSQTLKTILTLEDIQPDILSGVLELLLKARTKVKLETHQ